MTDDTRPESFYLQSFSLIKQPVMTIIRHRVPQQRNAYVNYLRRRAGGRRQILGVSPPAPVMSGVQLLHFNQHQLRMPGKNNIKLYRQRYILSAACHDAAAIRRAAGLGIDVIILSPILPTATHPGAKSLGYYQVARLLSKVPAYNFLLGGIGVQHFKRARNLPNIHGVAGVSLFLPGKIVSSTPHIKEDQ